MKCILLISSGIDSPVAGFLMKQKGIDLIGVNYVFNDVDGVVIDLAKKIGLDKLYVVNISKPHQEFMEKCNRKFQCVFCKRLMLRIAEKIAHEERADYIVTGENLGQVASQTLSNIAVTDAAVSLSVLRPILCFDKQEAVDIAKKIGTYDLSIKITKKCPMLPPKVATKSKIEFMEAEEEKIDLDSYEVVKVVEL